MDSAARLILLVEDCAATRMLYEHILADAGYRVIVAADGLEGVAKAQEQRPDLVVTDLDMPVLDGFETSRRIRRDPRTRRTPILVVTASPSRHCLVRAHDAGCDAYLTKPCWPSKLLDAIENVLRTRGEGERELIDRGGKRCAST